MQFITTDQRIAVENFEVGIIYTVTFSNGDSFTGACIGIGSDFVAFQRTAPKLLFCLTMTTAADVASIEPLSADIGQILEYTGTVPVSIKTNGSPLLDYLITGNTIQNGTPTPENPVMPQGCGELDSGQYKIPISSANTTTPVYLGEVETARRIQKYIFTGTEDWRVRTLPDNSYSINYSAVNTGGGITYRGVCSHFANPQLSVSNITSGQCYFGTSAVSFRLDDTTDLTQWTNWLKQQYQNGTPVVIWYVLAVEETGIVNEPLMRIGDYADTLSNRQSGVDIPTTDGLNIFDIDTIAKPSEVYLKYFSPLF